MVSISEFQPPRVADRETQAALESARSVFRELKNTAEQQPELFSVNSTDKVSAFDAYLMPDGTVFLQGTVGGMTAAPIRVADLPDIRLAPKKLLTFLLPQASLFLYPDGRLFASSAFLTTVEICLSYFPGL
jgi:hypothetical protein